MRGIALFSLLVLAGGPAFAAIDTAATRASGDWRLSEVGGKVACTLTLTRQTSFAGFELKAPLACRRAFPALKTVANWALDDKGGIRALRRPRPDDRHLPGAGERPVRGQGAGWPHLAAGAAESRRGVAGRRPDPDRAAGGVAGFPRARLSPPPSRR
ncbi:MAG: AprI/Inh family metalloprotease inhibitor [Caulobacteraceae bacterium]